MQYASEDKKVSALKMDKVRFFKFHESSKSKPLFKRLKSEKRHTHESLFYISLHLSTSIYAFHMTSSVIGWALRRCWAMFMPRLPGSWFCWLILHDAVTKTQWKLNEVSAIFSSCFLPWNLNPVWICLVIQNCIKVGKWILLYLRFKDHQSLESCVCQISWTIKKNVRHY